MRTDLWSALATALRDGPPPVVIASSSSGPLRRLTDALGERPIVVAGEVARYAIARGIAAEGGRAVVLLGRRVPPPDGVSLLGITTQPDVAARALVEGWPVARPALAEDVGPLLASAPQALALQLGPAAAADEPTPSVARFEPRVWRSGDHATLIVSGATLDVVLPISRMLTGRGVRPTVVEVPVMTSPAQAPLTGIDVFFAGPPEAVDEIAEGRWPEDLRRVEVVGRTPRHLMESILAGVPARAEQ